MDYAFCEGLKNSNLGGISRVILLYEINCQYCVYLKNRIEDSGYTGAIQQCAQQSHEKSHDDLI
jgi:hypothetical protein